MITLLRTAFVLAALGTAVVATPSAAQSTLEQNIAKLKKQKTRGLMMATPENTTTTNNSGSTATTETTAVALPEIAPEDQVNVNVTFDFDSAALRADQKPKLVELCQALVGADVQQVRILGHTDASGSAAYNLQLSTLRAQEVKRFLNSDCGYPLERMEAIGVGEERPFDRNNPNSDVNRRVEFQALS